MRYTGNGAGGFKNCHQLPIIADVLPPLQEFAFKQEGPRADYEREMEETSHHTYENYRPEEMERLRVSPGTYDPVHRIYTRNWSGT